MLITGEFILATCLNIVCLVCGEKCFLEAFMTLCSPSISWSSQAGYAKVFAFTVLVGGLVNFALPYSYLKLKQADMRACEQAVQAFFETNGGNNARVQHGETLYTVMNKLRREPFECAVAFDDELDKVFDVTLLSPWHVVHPGVEGFSWVVHLHNHPGRLVTGYFSKEDFAMFLRQPYQMIIVLGRTLAYSLERTGDTVYSEEEAEEIAGEYENLSLEFRTHLPGFYNHCIAPCRAMRIISEKYGIRCRAYWSWIQAGDAILASRKSFLASTQEHEPTVIGEACQVAASHKIRP